MKQSSKSASTLIYIVFGFAFFVLLFLLSSAPAPRSTHRHHRRLKLRSNSTSGGEGRSHGRRIPFDPIIADIERRFDDLDWGKDHHDVRFDVDHAPAMEAAPAWEYAGDAEDYINDESRFNLTQRIEELFPKIDVAPRDGMVTSEELTAWNLAQSRREALHRARRDMTLHDKNKDGLVAFEEYQRPSWAWRFDDNNSTNDGIGWWKLDHFNASDIDGDGYLNVTEFSDFLHPADSNNPKLIHWLCEQEVRERDKDNDGKLNFQEFFNGLFYLLRSYDDDEKARESENAGDSLAHKLFSRLDEDKDGFLTADELKPVIDKIHPTEHFYAKQQADYVVSQADRDKDGKLSMQEMADNPYIFYSAIFTDEDDYGFHDEFR